MPLLIKTGDNMNLVIAGYGFVGKAHHKVLKSHYDISIVDPAINDKLVSDYDADMLIISVATPQRDDGACDMKHVFEVLRDTHSNIPVLIKSTISLEGWDQIRKDFPKHKITFSPEYLRAATAEIDFVNTKSLEFGGDNAKLWMDVMHKVFPEAKFKELDPRVLILNKYARNSFLATKVSWFNQLHDLCEAYNVDYQAVADIVSSDHRIGLSHTDVTPKRGFGGHCFPKDTSALIHTAKNQNVDMSVLIEAVEYNNKIRS